MSQTAKIFLVIIIAAIAAGGGFYYWQSQQVPADQQTASESPSPAPSENTVNPSPAPSKNAVNEIKENFSIITILIPENYEAYKQAMTEYAQAGGQDPLLTAKFIKKELTIPYTNDRIKASAQAAAEEIAPAGGPPKASIAYLNVQNNTAYVLLDIDLDGWAGVSVSQAIIHPLVEKTLLQFPEINSVVFDYAPGDK